MLSPQAEQMHAALRAHAQQVHAGLATAAPKSLAEQRAATELFGETTGRPTGIMTEHVRAGTVDAIWVSPAGGDHGRCAVMWFHCGGFFGGSARAEISLAGHLAARSKMRILNLDYRLAPEHPFPAAIEDGVTGYRWLLEMGYSPRAVAIGGASAGGGLALATLLKIRDEGLPMPGAGLAFSAFADATFSGDSYETMRSCDYLFSPESAQTAWDYYLPDGTDRKDPLVSPAFGDFRRLPPLHLQVGGSECLLDETLQVAERGREAGLFVDLQVFPEMQHIFQFAAGAMPEADDALEQAALFLRSLLSGLDGNV